MIINRTEKWGKNIQTADYNGAPTVSLLTNVIFECSLIKTYTTEDSLLIFLLEKTTFEEYEKPIYFATNRDFVINKILSK